MTYSLPEVADALGIPYPTAARYATQYADRIPHEGEGRNRRFPPEALDVFREIRAESKPGRPRERDRLSRRLVDLERRLSSLWAELVVAYHEASKPVTLRSCPNGVLAGGGTAGTPGAAGDGGGCGESGGAP